MKRLLGLAAVLLLIAAYAGCSPQCEGVDVNGQCQKACHDDACATGSKCVENACRPACVSTGDCAKGQACQKVTSDYGTTGSFCVGGGTQTGSGEGASCKTNTDCALRYGIHCIAGTCTLTCETHEHCGSRGSCTGTAKDAEGKTVFTCETDSFPRAKGQFGTSCPNGDECTDGFTCVGAGMGDIDAYCTKRFCSEDAECPSGFYCATERTHATPCQTVCGLKGAATDSCIPAADIGEGKHYQCGPISLVTSACLHREFCNECTTDADCRGKANQVCAKDHSGAKICTVPCDPDANSCPWGNAANCGVWDEDLGYATCAHRFGSCTGTGGPCEPCVEQTDCPNGYCGETSFSGERYCVDMTVTCSCPAGTSTTCYSDCPRTPAPGNLPMNCLGGDYYVDSRLYGVCNGANGDPFARSSRSSCWPTL